MKLVLHCHTKYSRDSLLSFRLLYLMCRLNKIRYIAITEHNNIVGAIEFEKYCKERGNFVKVIIGEEIMTSCGEIIGLYLKSEIPIGLSPEEVIENIENQGGIVYIPHPYDRKRLKTVLKEEIIAKYKNRFDCIECHNGRNISNDYDEKQNRIAEIYGITKVVGSDAHTFVELGRNYMEIDIEPLTPADFRTALKTAKFHSNRCIKVAHLITKFVKAYKIIKSREDRT